jgi:hypothetical protein
MNNYYEVNMPSGMKPNQNSIIDDVKKYVKNKYVKKIWIDEDEDDPVYLFQNGEYEKKEKYVNSIIISQTFYVFK